jgi:hypothetical protein
LRPDPAISPEGEHVRTPSQPWAYAATIRIPPRIKGNHFGKAYLRVRLQVENGNLGVGVTTADESTFIDRKFFLKSPRPYDAYLTIPALKDAWELVFCNGDTNVSSTAIVYSAEIMYK